jgi:autonomous glycyl radical cofactor GrcA
MAGVEVKIGADSSKAARELKAFEKKTKSVASSIAKGFKERIGHKLLDGLAQAANAIGPMIKESVNLASSLNEEMGKSSAVFKESASGMQDWSKTTADALGMSRLQSLSAASTMGNMLLAFDVSANKAAEMSRRLVELAADMGSFNDVANEEAITALGAALRGENEPIRRFGVALDDARLKAKALELGLYDGKGALTGNAKAMAAYSSILEQTIPQQGNFAETSNDLANSQKIVGARFDELKIVIGEQLLPVVSELVTALKEIDWEGTGEGIKSAIGFLEEYRDEIKFTTDATNGLARAFKLFGEAKEVWDSAGGLESLPAPFQKEEREASGKGESLADMRRRKEEKEYAEAYAKELESIKDAEQDLIDQKKIDAQWTELLFDMAVKNEEIKKRELEAEKAKTAEKEKQAKLAREDFKTGLSQDIAETLSDFGIGSAKKENMLGDLMGIGFDKDEANRLVGLEGKRQDLISSRNDLGALSSRSSNIAVSSMQRIGGGGGVYGELDLQKRQTDLQAKMVDLLQELKNESAKAPLSEF